MDRTAGTTRTTDEGMPRGTSLGAVHVGTVARARRCILARTQQARSTTVRSAWSATRPKHRLGNRQLRWHRGMGADETGCMVTDQAEVRPDDARPRD